VKADRPDRRAHGSVTDVPAAASEFVSHGSWYPYKFFLVFFGHAVFTKKIQVGGMKMYRSIEGLEYQRGTEELRGRGGGRERN